MKKQLKDGNVNFGFYGFQLKPKKVNPQEVKLDKVWLRDFSDLGGPKFFASKIVRFDQNG